jgi:hypothetical protein
LKPPQRLRASSIASTGSKGGAIPPYQYRMNNRYQPQNKSRMPYVKKLSSTQIVTPQSNISYYITIDMYLQKGTELTDKDKSNLKCNHRWNSIRKNYAELRGVKYAPTPDYSMLPSSSTKTKPSSSSSSSSSSKTNKSKTQKVGLDLKRKNNRTTRRSYLSS